MKQVNLKPNKHILLLEIDGSITDGQRDEISKKLDELFPHLNVMLTGPTTEITLLTLED